MASFGQSCMLTREMVMLSLFHSAKFKSQLPLVREYVQCRALGKVAMRTDSVSVGISGIILEQAEIQCARTQQTLFFLSVSVLDLGCVISLFVTKACTIILENITITNSAFPFHTKYNN